MSAVSPPSNNHHSYSLLPSILTPLPPFPGPLSSAGENSFYSRLPSISSQGGRALKMGANTVCALFTVLRNGDVFDKGVRMLLPRFNEPSFDALLQQISDKLKSGVNTTPNLFYIFLPPPPVPRTPNSNPTPTLTPTPTPTPFHP